MNIIKTTLAALFFVVICNSSHAQDFKNLLKKAAGKDSSKINSVHNGPVKLSEADIIAGLKEALSIGADKGTSRLSALDGFFGNSIIKILMPEEAKVVESKLRSIGLGSQVDNAILSMNRAAESASKQALPIFISAIQNISIEDAAGILKGSDTAATFYLKTKTTGGLTNAFRPVIENALAATNATKYWNTIFSTYNKLSTQKINPDLTAYVTERALNGIFYQVASEEKLIRKDPLARTSDILKKVFGR